MTNPSHSILIVEDEVFIANDISEYLTKKGYSVAGIAYNANKALDMLSSRDYDLVILDINIGGSHDGIELADIINSKYKKPFIFLTSYSNEETLIRAQKTLPYGYLVKPFEEKSLHSTLKMALYRYSTENRSDPAKLEKLNEVYQSNISEREYELISLLLKGHNLRESAEVLFLSENTIKTHLKRIYQKLGVHNRVEFTKKIIEVV